MKKRVLLTMDSDLHHEMRVIATRRNVTLGALYELAARLLLSQAEHVMPACSPSERGGAR